MPLTVEQLQIPSNLRFIMQDQVLYSQSAGSLQLTTVPTFHRSPPYIRSKFVLKRRTLSAGFSAYGLNFIYDKIHTEGYKPTGYSSDSVIILIREEINTTVNGVAINIPESVMSVKSVGEGKVEISILTKNKTYTFIRSGKFVTYTVEQLQEMTGLTPQEQWELDRDFFYSSWRDPDKYITSVFVNIDGPGTEIVSTDNLNSAIFKGEIYVNGAQIMTDPERYSRLITCYNKSGVSYKTTWKLYNDCEGNFGLCIQKNPLSAGGEIYAVQFMYDVNKEFAVLELFLEEEPAQGKQYSVSGYLNLKTKEKIHALLTKPVS